MATALQSEVDPLLSDEFQHAPEKVIARLRARDPVHYIEPLDLWYVTRWDDVRALFTHPDATPDRRAYCHYAPPQNEYLEWISENGLFSAPPEQHARTRRLVTSAFTPRAIARMDGQIRDVVEQFAAPLHGARGVVDLVASYTGPIPSTVIGRITGIPPKHDDELRFRQLAREVISGISPLLPPAERARAESSMLELCEYVRGLAAERRRAPEDDLVSDLVTAHEDPMTNEEIIFLVAALVAAGTETTAMGSTLGLRTLFQHPDQLALLRRDRSLLPNAVREILRYDFGTAGLPRYALRDFELRGRQIRKGQLLLLSFMGAHRDPEVFPDPDRFDVRRDTSSLTIFGHGPHYCIGANLAQFELRQIFDTALDFLPERAVLREDLIEITRLGMFARLETLPVDFGG